LVATSILTDPILRSVLLLAGDGLLMVVRRIQFALLRLRVLSTLRLASLNGVLAFLMRSCSFLAFRSPRGLNVLFIADHMVLRC
jgi:hypothetical protein